MGSHNRITEEKYKTLKSKLKSPADDARVVKQFGVSLTVCRMVRNTNSYAEYCERRFRYHGNPNKKRPATHEPRRQEAVPRPPVVLITRDLEDPRDDVACLLALGRFALVCSIIALGIVAYAIFFRGGK